LIFEAFHEVGYATKSFVGSNSSDLSEVLSGSSKHRIKRGSTENLRHNN
jgi:hypothetical protein